MSFVLLLLGNQTFVDAFALPGSQKDPTYLGFVRFQGMFMTFFTGLINLSSESGALADC